MAKIGILGPGAVGGFLAATFCRAGHSVVCVARPETAELINQQGIFLESKLLGDFQAYPTAATSLDQVVDILFITTKAMRLPNALERIGSGLASYTFIIPLLNGIEHMRILRDAYGDFVVAGTISIEAYRTAPNRVTHSSSFARINIASGNSIFRQWLEVVAADISRAGIEVGILPDEEKLLWGKLVRLNAIACLTSATDKPIGFIRSIPEWRLKLEKCVREAAKVAGANGVKIEPKQVMAFIDRIDPHQMSSMQRDVSQGRECEIDAIAGAIVRAGRRYWIECPTIKYFIEKIKARIDTE